MQRDCAFGECRPVGYGFVWYETYRILSSKDAPRILFITQNFVKDPAQLDSQLLTVTFNASQAFFDYAGNNRNGTNDQGIIALNAETEKMSGQKFTVQIKELLQGITRQMKVGVLSEDKSVHYVNAELTCTASK